MEGERENVHVCVRSRVNVCLCVYVCGSVFPLYGGMEGEGESFYECECVTSVGGK